MDWQDIALRRAQLRQVLSQTDVQNLLPEPLTDFIISRKLSDTIGRTVFNYSEVARNLPKPFTPEALCPCRQLFPRDFRPKGGCVKTGSLRIITLSSLRNLLSYGARFRSRRMNYDPLIAIEKCLNRYIKSHSKVLPKASFLAWKETVLERCSSNLSRYAAPKTHHKPVFTSEDVKYLTFIQKYLVIHYIDKAANNLAFRCKSEYVRRLSTELNAPIPYTSVTESEKKILSIHKSYLDPLGFWQKSCNRLGYVYIATKFHKDGERFVAGMHNCSTTALSKMLSDVCNFLLFTLQQKDDDFIRRTGIRRFFVVNGYEDVTSFFKHWRFNSSKSRSMRSGDFSTMFTDFPHDDLIAQLDTATSEAWSYAATILDIDLNSVHLFWDIDGCIWKKSQPSRRKSNKKPSFCYSKTDILSHMKWLIMNTFVINGGSIRRQYYGLPMGTNSAPGLTNLCLYTYEAAYIDKLLVKNLIVMARAFHMSFRLIDDLTSVDNPFYDDFFKSCYPSFLTFNDTTLINGDLNFLGMHIFSSASPRLIMDVFDKRKDFPFTVIRFPNMDSAIPSSISYGVFTGMLYRFFNICGSLFFFIQNAVDVATTLESQGASRSRLFKTFSSFLNMKSKFWASSKRSVTKDFSDLFKEKIRFSHPQRLKSSLCTISHFRTSPLAEPHLSKLSTAVLHSYPPEVSNDIINAVPSSSDVLSSDSPQRYPTLLPKDIQCAATSSSEVIESVHHSVDPIVICPSLSRLWRRNQTIATLLKYKRRFIRTPIPKLLPEITSHDASILNQDDSSSSTVSSMALNNGIATSIRFPSSSLWSRLHFAVLTKRKEKSVYLPSLKTIPELPMIDVSGPNPKHNSVYIPSLKAIPEIPIDDSNTDPTRSYSLTLSPKVPTTKDDPVPGTGTAWLNSNFPSEHQQIPLPPGVILNRNTPRAYLTDIQVANIMYELWKPYNSMPYILKYPQSFQLVKKMSFRLPGKVYFVPINTGASHWILVTLDRRRNELLLFNSCGTSKHDLNTLTSKLRHLPPNVKKDFVKQKVQFDGFQCGIWISWAFESLLHHLKQDDSILTFDPLSYLDNSPQHDILIATLRDSYTSRLEEAYVDNTLGWLS
jgi:hypothetical protein